MIFEPLEAVVWSGGSAVGRSEVVSLNMAKHKRGVGGRRTETTYPLSSV